VHAVAVQSGSAIVNHVFEATSYLLGDTDRELARLIRQAALFSDFTEDVFRKAGVTRGMRVLDVGCGVGDVSMIAAALVGPEGSVVGIDRSPAALDIARARVEREGLSQVRFVQADLHDVVEEGFDAIVGRFILIHLPDPAASLRILASRLRRGGILAFVEMDIGVANAVPRSAIFSRCLDLITRVYRKGGMEPDMGSRLFAEYRAAGFDPVIAGNCRVEAGPESHAYDYLADSLRSLLPSMVEHGLATAQEMDVDTLSARLRAESLAHDLCFIFPLTVGAWARAG
jgi:ubiquinone/menaquinone biosynthesis C-methylase UbiE